MEHGTITYLEVLTAQQSLLSAQLTQVANEETEIQSIIQHCRKPTLFSLSAASAYKQIEKQ